MKFADLGINENRGGGALIVTGTVTKNSPWAMIDKETKQPVSGHSLQLAFYGGVLKVGTEDGDPLRNLGIGEEVTLRMKISSPKGKPEQLGPAILLDPKSLAPQVANTPSSS